MNEMQLTVTIDGDAAERLATLAAESGRSVDWYAAYIIREYAELELAEVRVLKARLENARNGKTIPHEEARRRLRATIENAARRPAAE